jgi:Na+-transporting NADH:ubiquinone oxidoreductase subunit NqrB
MKSIIVKRLLLVAILVVFGAMFAIAKQAGAQATPKLTQEQSLTGTVTCTGRITHQYTCQRNQTLQTCTLACVDRGSEFVLIVKDQPYILEGNKHNIEEYAGGKATVMGTVTLNRILVHAVSDAKHK